MFKRASLLLVVLVVLAGCSAPVAPPSATADADPWAWPDDPPSDRLGWENGYWYNESITVDQSDGLNQAEIEAFVGRTMARVEHIRGLEFTEPVPVEVISREEYREQVRNDSDRDHAYERWNNQVWEALLLVDEDRNVSDVFDELYGGAVLGYYEPGEDRIVIVNDGESPVIDRQTLAHELVHALQDQQFGFESQSTQDTQLAYNSVVEGDARYVDRLYEQQCAAGWSCVETPAGGGAGGGWGESPGVFLTIYAPYSEGAAFVNALYERGGWAAVNDAYDRTPASSEQVIHPEKYPDEAPVEVSVPDQSAGNWSRFDVDDPADTVGEASIFAMFWQNRMVENSYIYEDAGNYSAYNYDHPISAGWAGDAVVPYHSDDGEYGYVFRIVWDTEADAEKFETKYRTMLLLRLGAERVDGRDDLLRIPDSRPYGDAFWIDRDGRTVTVVNAPTVGELDDVYGPAG